MSFDPVPVRTQVAEKTWRLIWWARSMIRPTRYSRLAYEQPYIWVSPRDIVYKTARAFRVRRYHGAILDGEWDTLGYLFEDLDVYRAFRARFFEGTAWSQTEFYQRVLRNIADGETKFGCRTKEEFDRRCKRLDALYQEVAREGIRINPGEPSRDISVNIGRHGDILFNEGRHRLSMGKLLDLPIIPVRITVQHAAWVRLGDVARDYLERHAKSPT